MRSKRFNCWVGCPAGQYRIILDTDSILGQDESLWQKMQTLYEMCVSTMISPGKQRSIADMEAACIGRRVGWKKARDQHVGRKTDYCLL